MPAGKRMGERPERPSAALNRDVNRFACSVLSTACSVFIACTGQNGEGGSAGKCPLPTTFNWTSTPALAQPNSGWVSLKDFSSVVYNDQHIVYMSTVDSAGA